MGGVGALILAIGKRRFSMPLLKQALENTAKLATFVMFILIGSTVFSFTFNSADGHIWVEHLFTNMPGGGWGFLIVVNLLVFFLGMFIDFFEIAFIVIPLLAPVAEKILPGLVPGMTPDAAMIWFGVMIAMNLQTSFLTPPFGFALFYLRSVAARTDYKDRITGETIKAVTTTEIYKGSIAFIGMLLLMLAAIMIFPKLVVGDMTQEKGLSKGAVMDLLQSQMDEAWTDPAPPDDVGQQLDSSPPALEAPQAPTQDADPMKAIEDAVARDAATSKLPDQSQENKKAPAPQGNLL